MQCSALGLVCVYLGVPSRARRTTYYGSETQIHVCLSLYVHVRAGRGGVIAACELAKQDNNGRIVSAGVLVVGLNG